MPGHLFCLDRHLKWVRCITGAVAAVMAFMSLLSSAALGANPAEEMAKMGAGGIDLKGNSWVSIQQSIQQFAHPEVYSLL
jgi:hypothetical protein